ncbi:MAG: TolC family protein [Planctomycetes bacterium]|nr:TolC family protein [Planctomycetota bacterium]
MIRFAMPMLVVVSSTLLLSGCTSVPKHANFPDVQDAVAERTGQQVQWNRLSADDRAVNAALRDMLGQELTADRAVQVALLNNRNLQATYEDLGVAQAEVVQAGLLRNPVFDAQVKFVEGGGGTKLELAVVQDFLDVFLIPLRKRVAEDGFAAATLRVTGAVLDLAGQARTAFYGHQAAEQTLELRQTVTAATAASYELAKRLHAAGNITDLDLAQERALHEQAKLDLAQAETAVLDGRERLNVLMGLWGTDTGWAVVKRLPDLPDGEPVATGDAERRAVETSLDLAIARSDVQARARTLGIRRSFGLLPEAEAGVAAEREAEGDWSVGPAISLPIPLFDQGQAGTAKARAELGRARQQYIATAVAVRSAARAARNRLLAARARADYYRKVILPLRQEITRQTQLQYNAMQVGAFQLLQAKREQVEAGVAYIDALRDYWVARTRFEQITTGRLTDLGESGPTPTSTSGASDPSRGSGGH